MFDFEEVIGDHFWPVMDESTSTMTRSSRRSAITGA